MPLSTGAEAVFVIDGRHRLLAAAATNVDELDVYIGKAKKRFQKSSRWLLGFGHTGSGR
jgi:hypothetical protein